MFANPKPLDPFWDWHSQRPKMKPHANAAKFPGLYVLELQ